jgi:tripartite-type tricarboxylate transporter receptor subunit TctC
MNLSRRYLLGTALAVATSVASFSFAPQATMAAETYPDRPVTLLVPAAAGGTTDIVARLMAEGMTKELGQQFIVDNKGGASGNIGIRTVARAEPDGYTLLINHVAQATSSTLYRKLAYDPDGAFDGIGLITDVPMTLVAKPDFAPNTVGELLDYIRREKDNVTYAHAGVGSASHLCGMLLMDALDASMTTVSYKGTGPAMTDLLGGQVDMMCDQTTNTVNQINAGKIKGYAVTTKERLPVLPNLPTLDEAGLKGFEMTVWHGLFAPAGTPKEIIEKLAGALQVALKDPKVVDRFAQLGTAPVAPEQASPAALDQHLAAEIGKWKPIIQAAGVYAD